MTKFKRCLSAFLAFAMIFGMFSGMGNVFAPEAAAAATLGNPTIKTFAELDAQYDNFVYFATEVYEVDTNTPTDGKVKPGQWLEYRAHYRSDMWCAAVATGILYDVRFFDARMTSEPTVSTIPESTFQGYEVGTKTTNNFNPAHPMTPRGGVTLGHTAKPCTIVNQYTSNYTALDEATYSNLADVWQTLSFDNSVHSLAFDYRTDTWFLRWYVRVQEEPTITETTTWSDPSTWKNKPHPTLAGQGDPRVNSNVATGAIIEGEYDDSTAALRSTCKNMNLAAKFSTLTVLLDDTVVNFQIEKEVEPVPGTSKVKTFAELDAQYDNFVYFGVDVHEVEADAAGNVTKDWGLTDGYVKPGQWLEYRAQYRSDMWCAAVATGILYDVRFFDARMTSKPVVSTIPETTFQGYEVGTKTTDNFNPDHPMTPRGGVTLGHTAKPCTIVNQYTSNYTALDEATYTNLADVWQTLSFDNSVHSLAFDYRTDTWFLKWYVKVLDEPTITETTTWSDPSTWKNKPHPTLAGQGDPRVNSNVATGDIIVGEYDDSTAALRSTCKNMNLAVKFSVLTVLLDDSVTHFKLGDPPVAGEGNTATFVVDGETVSEETYSEGDTIVVPEDPTKAGYKFMGWSDGSAIVTEFVMGTEDVTYTAVFVATHTAKFVVDGVKVSEEVYAEGETIVAPADPTKTGFTFAGWDKTVGTMGTADITFNATWSEKTYTVEYFKESTDTAAWATLSVAFNGAYNLPTPPTKTGYNFVKWVDASGNDMPATHTADANAKFYAKWEKATFNAIFDANGGLFASGDSISVPTLYGEAIVAPAEVPTRTGYSFAGWEGYTEGTTIGAADVTFEAIWEADTIGVHFMDGEEELQLVPSEYGSKVYQIANPSKTGYTFKGWNYADGSAVSWPITVGTDDVYVYAVWEGNDITINFYGETESDWYAYTILKAGAELVVPEDAVAPSKTGYTFVGYFDAEGNAMPATVPAQDTNYFAKFEAVTYTATFVDGEAEVGKYEGIYGSTIVAPADPEKTGYTFAGWEGYTAGMKMPATDKTFTAKWTVNKYDVIYYVDGVEVHRAEVEFGAAIPEYTYTPDDAGVNFGGWTTAIPETMPAEDVSIYGTTGVNTYNVTFTINGEEHAVLPFAYGAAVTAPDYEVPAGYTFSGWDVPATMPAQNLTINATLTAKTYYAIFYLDDAKTIEYTRVPTVFGEAINVPVDPQVDGKEFVEWDPMPDAMTEANDMEFVAVFENIDYFVTFYNEDGTVIDGYDYMLFWGDEVTAEMAPEVSKEGYDFAGWYDASGAKVTFPVVVNSDIDLTARFTVQGYKVYYYVDGAEYDFDAYEFGAAVTLRAPLAKEGYTFTGWNDADGNAAVLPGAMPSHDITVYGTWTINSYNAIFVGENGWTETVATNYNAVPEAPTAPEKAGYAFVGWKAADGKVYAADKLPAMGAADATYEAVYSAGDVTYTVETYIMDTTGAYGEPEVDTLTGATDSPVSVAPEAKEGFTLDTDASVLEGVVAADGSTTLKVYYIRNQYTFTTVIDGVEDSTDYYFEAAVNAPADPAKEGYTFTGWDGTVPSTMPANDVTVTAKFQINQYTITFDTDGGSPIAQIKADFGTAVKTPADPTKTGYTFAGWDKAIPATIPAENITITAQWTVNQYTITFVDTGDVAYEEIKQDYNTAIDPVADPVKTGYTFLGWDVKIPETMPAEDMTITATWKINQYEAKFIVDGKETIVKTNYNEVPVFADPAKLGHAFAGWEPALAPIGVDGATYTAQWTALPYDAIFDANNGAWADGATSITVKDVIFGTPITAPAEEPVREGYKFAGWDPAVGTMDAEGMTFTAQWTQDLSYCRIKGVERITEGVFEEQRAVYKITVEGAPVKIQFKHNVENGTSWTYDRGTGAAADYIPGDLTASGLVAVQGYDANDNPVASFGAPETAYEVWTIVTILTEGDYKVRAKLDYSSTSWEDINFAYDYTMTFDEKTIVAEDMIISANPAATTVKRGEYVNVTFVTAPEVDRVRIIKDNGDGTSTMMSYSAAASAVQIDTNTEGKKVWTVKIRFTYSSTADEDDQNWAVWFRVEGDAAWINSGKSFDIKVTKYAQATSPSESYAAYTVISATAPANAVKGEYTTVTVVTTSDITRVRLNNQAGKTATYLKTSSNVTYEDNGDGTATWTINYRFTTEGAQSWAAQGRGNAWTAITDATTFAINVA